MGRVRSATSAAPMGRALCRVLLLGLPVALSAAGLLAAPAAPADASFSPTFTAATASSRAGAFSPESVTISRGEDQEELGSIAMTNPPGLLGALSAVGICPGARAEAASCPAAASTR